MIITIGEHIRKSDENLALMICMLMRMKQANDIENFKVNKDDFEWTLSYLKQPFEPGRPFPWMH